MPTSPTTIPNIPTPVPQRSDPTNFAARADATLTALPLAVDGMNATATNVFNNATEAFDSATDAAQSVVDAAAQVALAANQVTLATNQVGLATAQVGLATTQANNAAASAASALNAPGTNAASSTSLTVGLGSKSATIQTGKAYAVGQTVVFASTAAPNNIWMIGPITAFNSGTGAITFDSQLTKGSGTFSAWTVSLAAAVAAQNLTSPTLVDPIVQLSGTNGAAGQVPVSQGAGLPPVWGLPGVAAVTQIASATTTDIGASPGEVVEVTGTTAISSFGVAPSGITRVVRFTGVLSLNYNATSMRLPGGTSIVTSPGDIGIFFSTGGGNWECSSYSRFDRRPDVVTAVTNGGTGVTSFSTGALVVGSSSSSLSQVPVALAGNFLQSNGSSWVGSTTLGAANGGTGLTSAGTSGNFLQSNGSGWVSQSVLGPSNGGTGVSGISGTPGTVLVSNGSQYTTTTAVRVAQGGTGLTSVGTSGNVLTSNGSAWVSQPVSVATPSNLGVGSYAYMRNKSGSTLNNGQQFIASSSFPISSPGTAGSFLEGAQTGSGTWQVMSNGATLVFGDTFFLALRIA